MPYVNDPCPVCEDGFIQECNPPTPPGSYGPGDPGCITCSECDYHDTAELPFEVPSSPFGTTASSDFTRAFNSILSTQDEEQDVVPADPQPTTAAWDYGSLVLPPGLRWNRYPAGEAAGQLAFNQPNGVEYPQQVADLREWAAQNDVVVEPSPSAAANLGGGYARRPTRVYIRRPDMMAVPSMGWDEDFECPICGETHLAYTTSCADGTPLRCAACLFYRDDLRNTREGPIPRFLCIDCRHECADEGCEVEVYDTQFCENHGHSAECFHCGYWIELSIEENFDTDGNGEIVCGGCAARCCRECGNYSRRGLPYSEEHNSLICRRCLLGGDDAEAFDENDQAELHIPAIPGRENIRLCGVEIEGGEGTGTGRDLAQEFHNLGLSEWDNIGSYHSGSEGGFAHVERDSSVDWEAVIGPVDITNPDDVEALDECIKAIRQLVRDGVLTLDLRAGCHIHVEAARTSLDGAYNLNLLFAFMEDVIFRLGAARWPVHRAVQDTHYTQPIPKELRKVQFAQHHAEGDNSRYYALSFNNYFQQMLSRCRCGATRYDSWEDCTCSLGKCTFEFRVFNTTANPRKLHAYLALCQALVAKAMSLGRIDGDGDELFPALSFVARRFKDMDGSAQEELVESWRERLAWLFNELPLTDDEKASLAYCVRYSELEAVGEEFIETLLPEQQVIEEVTA